jgi:hypothetical protein
MTMRSVGVMQELTREDKLKARSARFEREADAAEAGRAVALANLRRDTAMAWLDRHYQERMREVLRTQRRRERAADRGGRGRLPRRARYAGRRVCRALGGGADRRPHPPDRAADCDAKTMLRAGSVARCRPGTGTPPSWTPRRGLNPGRPSSNTIPQIALMAKQEAVARADADIAQSNKRSGLERGVDVQPAQPGLLEHGLGQRLDPAAVGSEEPAGP